VREVDGEYITQDLLNRPQLVTNWSQYVERYGEFIPGAYLSHAVYGYFLNGGTRCYVVSVTPATTGGQREQAHSSRRASGRTCMRRVRCWRRGLPEARGAYMGAEGDPPV
jgi:hypothetical protein